jgi:CRISPR-associated protein Csc2
VFTLNAPYEDGTMSDRGEVASRINPQDHVKPQVIFPSVITTRDLTWTLFGYVLQNVLRTSRYGAATTRGGTVRNHIAAIILSDGEIFSNLLLTQHLFDWLKPDGIDPVAVNEALTATEQIIPMLLEADGTRDAQVLIGDDLRLFLNTIRGMDEDAVRAMFQQAKRESETYFRVYIAKQEKRKN